MRDKVMSILYTTISRELFTVEMNGLIYVRTRQNGEKVEELFVDYDSF